MSNEDIIRIDLIKGVCIKNEHNGYTFPRQNVLNVTFRNGNTRTLDLFSNLDISNVDYFKIVVDKKSKYKTIFKEVK